MIYTERLAIKQRLDEIRIERKELIEEYHRLINRLKEIDDYDRESVDSEGVIQSLLETVNTLKKLIPNVTPQQVLEYIDKNNTTTIIRDHRTRSINVPNHEIKLQQTRDSLKVLDSKPKKDKSRATIQEVSWAVEKTLKEHGGTLKLDELRMNVEEKLEMQYSRVGFSAMIKRIVDKGYIKKVRKGIYTLN